MLTDKSLLVAYLKKHQKLVELKEPEVKEVKEEDNSGVLFEPIEGDTIAPSLDDELEKPIEREMIEVEDKTIYDEPELLALKEYEGHKVDKVISYTKLTYNEETGKVVISGIELRLANGQVALFINNEGEFCLTKEHENVRLFYFKQNRKSNIVVVCDFEDDVDLLHKHGLSAITWRGKYLEDNQAMSLRIGVTRNPNTVIWVWGRTAKRTKALARTIRLLSGIDYVPHSVIKKVYASKASSSYRIVDYSPNKHFVDDEKSIKDILVSNNIMPLVDGGELKWSFIRSQCRDS